MNQTLLKILLQHTVINYYCTIIKSFVITEPGFQRGPSNYFVSFMFKAAAYGIGVMAMHGGKEYVDVLQRM